MEKDCYLGPEVCESVPTLAAHANLNLLSCTMLTKLITLIMTSTTEQGMA
jgi:hypothetical protein